MEKIKVLIPTDFGVPAEYAYQLVRRLSEQAALEVHFLHVLEVPDTVTMDAKGRVQTCGEIDPGYIVAQKQIAERQLAALQAHYGQDVQVALQLGKITDTITAFARAGRFDLIVMGTQGAWGVKGRLSGSETQMVARHAEVPVLSLMCDRSQLTLRNVLVVHDFAEHIDQTLPFMRRLRDDFGVHFHLFQLLPHRDEALVARTHAHMHAFAQAQGMRAYTCHVDLDSDVAHGVTHFGHLDEMDIVCIGTHGKRGFFHSSATEELIQHLFKPILSFHIPA
jgi:nucleotide-binding universal stress UspA family protein